MQETNDNLLLTHNKTLNDIEKQYIPYVKENIFDRSNIQKYLIETETKIFYGTDALVELNSNENFEDALEMRNILDKLNNLRSELQESVTIKEREFIELEKSRNTALTDCGKSATIRSLTKKNKFSFLHKLFAPFLQKVNGLETFNELVLYPLKQRNDRIIDIELPRVAEEVSKTARINNAGTIDIEDKAVHTIQEVANEAKKLNEKYNLYSLEEMSKMEGRFYVKGLEIASSENSNEVSKVKVGGTLTKLNTKSLDEILKDAELNNRVSASVDYEVQNNSSKELNKKLLFET